MTFLFITNFLTISDKYTTLQASVVDPDPHHFRNLVPNPAPHLAPHQPPHPAPHPALHPHQFADDKPKCVEF